jgi:hypothetical protein
MSIEPKPVFRRIVRSTPDGTVEIEFLPVDLPKRDGLVTNKPWTSGRLARWLVAVAYCLYQFWRR